MAATRRKKKNVRRTSTRGRRKTARRGGKRKLPNWSLLVLGLSIGIVVAVSIQWAVQQARTPGTGLYNLFSRPTPPRPKPVAKHAAPATPPRTTFDFYTILPETETVIPDREWEDLRHNPEKGSRYILQAASYNNFQQADKLKARLAINGLVAAIQKVTIGNKGTFYRVRLGPYGDAASAEAVNRKLSELGIHALRLRLKKEG
jgi:cell division protein FtsN